MGLIQKIFGKEVRAFNNYELLPEELRKEVLNVSIAFNKYGAYCVPLSSQHRTLCQKILKGEVFEPDTIRYMTENAGEGDIVHAGTFFGDFLPALSRSVGEGRHVWAFEPNTENYRCAQMTITLNSISNVHLIQAGLGAKASKAAVLLEDSKGKGLGGCSKIVDAIEDGTVTEQISVVTLDEVIPQDRAVSILQLDVEGYEEQALKGAIRLIKRCRPILILEDDQGVTNSSWFKENVLALGYEIAGKLHYNTLILPEERQS
jgi:FkbM family methyltransferase